MDPTRTDPRRRAAPPREGFTWIAAWTPDPRLVGTRRTLAAGERLVLGRASPGLAPGVEDDALLSRRHLSMEVHADHVDVLDLDSRNGTQVDGAPIRSAQLRDGAVLAFGDQLWVLRRGPAEAEPDPTSAWWGCGPAAAAVHAAIARYAGSDAPVCLIGETGTGKEVVAGELHRRSQRAGAFVVLDCTTVPDPLLAAELAGHVRGAFTGAEAPRGGLARAADRGTLFVDEVGDASPALQAALLRLVQDGTVRPVGADTPVTTRARIVAATHRDLPALAAEGRFRADLLARLRHLTLRLPPLRERPEDVGLLAQRFAPSGTRPSRAAVAALLRDPLPGNVRELAARMVRAALDQPGAVELEVPADPPPAPAPPVGPPTPEALRELLAAHGSVSAIARTLGVGRSTAYRWVKAAGLGPR